MIEIAEVFRRFAADYLAAHGASMLPSHRRAIDDIINCRTAALGGQVWRCEACNAEVFSYHSCVMGKISNGELAAAPCRLPTVLSPDGAASHPHLVPISPDLPALRLIWLPIANDREERMLETYFGSPKMLAHLRAGPSGPYMDGFAGSLELSGYELSVAVRYLRAAAHIGHFTLEQGGDICRHGFVGIHTPFANLLLCAAKRGTAQPPYSLRRQALPRIPCRHRCRPTQ